MISLPRTLVFGGEWEGIMKTRYTVALSMIAGAALAGAAIQGLHAQAKPAAYVITEVEIIDQAAFNEFSPKVPATMQPFGGKYLVRGGKVIPLDGDAPKRVIVRVYDHVEKAQALFLPPRSIKPASCSVM